MTDIADQQQRQQALDPHHSFIVQAPAGSGKTELLTQRILTLLAESVASPEEIIAITFTRKAASEMRERIIAALQMGQLKEPQEPHKKLTWQIARKVLAKDQQRQWNLLQNPNRMRVLTIDALSTLLNSFTPLLSSLGSNIKITDDAAQLYQKATERLLQTQLKKPDVSDAINKILLHLDNRVPLFIALCNRLLAKREQWLPYIIIKKSDHTLLKQLLEQSLQQVVIDHLTVTSNLFSTQLWSYLTPILKQAGLALQQTNPDHPVSRLAELKGPLTNRIADVKLWQAMAHIMLTQKFEWRKTIDKRLGFPANSEHKKAMCELLASLSDHTELKAGLASLLRCPPTHYLPTQWDILSSLLKVLPILVANLQIIMQQQASIDFTELSLAALRSLGNEEQPTDLALYLDYQIKHLLIDEYQDTSVTQYKLIQMLTAGWEEGDGHTAFFVGDPMQSIYRFRNAEVGLFLTTKQYGINQIKCHNLTLKVNFRSSTSLVNWTNQTYQHVFPAQSNSLTGAINYSASLANNANEDKAIHYYASLSNEGKQGQIISDIILQLQTNQPTDSIALLVRSRNQLRDIIPMLQQKNITYQAIDIDPLIKQPEIQDLVTITQSLLHHADRCAWLALLRAPWCGLILKDLQIIAGDQPTTLWSNIQNPAIIQQLSSDGQKRIATLTPIITKATEQKGRLSLTENVKATWYYLAGPTCVKDQQALSNCFDYFKFLEQLETEHPTLSTHQLLDAIHHLYAKPTSSHEHGVQIMTIHKAKGLEFDHVILANLAYSPRTNPSQLLLWQQQSNLEGHNQLLLAPIKAQSESQDAIYDFIEYNEKQKRELETARLLYVATTRAKKTLHLTTELTTNPPEADDYKQPARGSFLYLLWPLYQQEFCSHLLRDNATEHNAATEEPCLLARLPLDFQYPLELNTHSTSSSAANNLFDIGRTIAVEHERICGTIIHALFEKMSKQSISTWNTAQLKQQQNVWQRQLRQALIPTELMQPCIEKIHQAATHILDDPKGRWILSDQHPVANSEYRLSYVDNDACQQLIIDRFIIDKNSIGWIIDYKTSQPHSQQSLAEFLQQETRHYQDQLKKYANVIRSIYDIEIHCALYFPMISTWHELTETKMSETTL